MKGVQAKTVQLLGWDGKRAIQALQAQLGIQRSLKPLCLATDRTFKVFKFYLIYVFLNFLFCIGM